MRRAWLLVLMALSFVRQPVEWSYAFARRTSGSSGDRGLRMKRERQVEQKDTGLPLAIECISAVSLATHDMVRAVRFYRALGFTIRYGGEGASFTSLHAGSSYLNLIAQPVERQWCWWGRVIFY